MPSVLRPATIRCSDMMAGRGQETTLIWSGLIHYVTYVFTCGVHFRPQCKYVLKCLIGYFLRYTSVIISKKQSVNVILS